MSKSWLSDSTDKYFQYTIQVVHLMFHTMKPILTSTELLSMEYVLTLMDISNIDGIQFINNTDTL